jgi:DNA-binding NtrC family response regulator
LLNSDVLEVQEMHQEPTSVLIIDDDETIARTFSRILQKKGYVTDIALTGQEALHKSRLKLYDVALIDVCLPDANGAELSEQLHGSEKMLKIIITGFPAMCNKNNVCLIKPVKPEKILELIELKLKEENGRL